MVDWMCQTRRLFKFLWLLSTMIRIFYLLVRARMTKADLSVRYLAVQAVALRPLPSQQSVLLESLFLKTAQIAIRRIDAQMD